MCHSCEGKCVTARFKGRQDVPQAAWVLAFRGVKVNVSPSQAWKALVFWGFLADECPEDGCSIAFCPWNAMYKASRHIAVVAAAMRTSERGVEHAGFDKVFTA